MTQVELEQEISIEGRMKAHMRMEKNEQNGDAANNPYASPIYRRFVVPLAQFIREAREKPRYKGAAAGYIKGLEEEAAAYIAVRLVLVTLLEGVDNDNARELMKAIGSAVQGELILRQFQHLAPHEYALMVNELGRKHSKNLRQRLTLAGINLRNKSVAPINWSKGGRDQVGAFLLEGLRSLGMVEVWHSRNMRRKKMETHCRLTDELRSILDNLKEMVEETMPYFLPCIEPPKDWVDLFDGGYHTPEMRRLAHTAVIHGGKEPGDTTILLKAMNTLQRVRWAINDDILDVVKQAVRVFETEEVVRVDPPPSPCKPAFLGEGMKQEDMTDEQRSVFVVWKRAMAEWHTQCRMRGQRFGRMYNAISVAERFKRYDALHFVYYADFRGRFYPRTSGVNPQGSDLQKALLRFADGKPLADEGAKKWFLIHGANRYGVDKVPFAERLAWVKENHELIIDIATNPLDRRDWTEADAPFQFLAWCFEYADYCRSPDRFVSYLPIGMDGSCNGLQNFSALLRDPEGAVSVNIIPGDSPRDIYRDVAERTLERVREAPESPYQVMWLEAGITRSTVKRSVMTLPYGSTLYSCRDFLLEALFTENPSAIPNAARPEAATWLSKHVWAAIGDVVVKAREAMDWLQKASSEVLKGDAEVISWVAPTGYRVTQEYTAWEESGQIRVELFGGSRLRCFQQSDKVDKHKHRNGIAPNFVHSLDASHMQFVAARCEDEGILSLAMIHDDFGTHAADCAAFSRIIREEFLRMYFEHDPLREFAEAYGLEGVPEKGHLNLAQVLDSQYFFA